MEDNTLDLRSPVTPPRPSTEIIAEIANAHQGSHEVAGEIARNAWSAKADAVKFQIYFGEELLTKSHPRYHHFKNQAFSPEEWHQLVEPLIAANVRVYCDVLGTDALSVASDLKVAGIKIHSSDLSNTPLLEMAANFGGRILIGVGGSRVHEINHALEVFRDAGIRPVLLHGFQAYPTSEEERNLERLRWLQTFQDFADIGYMDHASGESIFSTVLPCMALALGATVIEKHVTLDRSERGVDYFSSINAPTEFERFVRTIRTAERSLGSTGPNLQPTERVYRDQVKKHWVATRALKSGHTITATDIVMKRTPQNVNEPIEISHLLEHQLLNDAAEDTPILRRDIANRTWILVVARMGSSRLWGKALADIHGLPALGHLLTRLKRCRRADHIVLCTTETDEDDALELIAQNIGISCYRGQTNDVLNRMLGALRGRHVDAIVRVTGDDILVAPEYLDHAIAYHFDTHAEYTDLKSLPSGTEGEVFDVSLLRRIAKAAIDTEGTEYLTEFVTNNQQQIRCVSAPVQEVHSRNWRLTIDTNDDLELVREVISLLRERGKGLDYTLDDLITVIESNPVILEMNSHIRQRATPKSTNTHLRWEHFF